MLKCVAFLGVLVGTVVTAQAPRTVPSYLLAEAQRPPLEFAFVLANASVPSGIEVKGSDDVYPKRRQGDDRDDRDQAKQVPASDLVMAFNAQHRDYTATLMDNVFVIRPVDGRARFLDGPSTIAPPVTVVGIMLAERTIFAPLDPRLLGPAVGSYPREALKGLTARIVLDGTKGRTVIHTLNQIALQMPGAWQVTTQQRGREWEVTEFGFIYSGFSGTRNGLGRPPSSRPRRRNTLLTLVVIAR